MRSKMSSILNSNCLINSEKEFINDSDKTSTLLYIEDSPMSNLNNIRMIFR